MPEFLNRLPEVINKSFDILDLLAVRITLLGLIILGAYTLFKNHTRCAVPPASTPTPKPPDLGDAT